MRREIPYTSWQDFLKLEAGNGNEVALAVLRSRNESAEPEQPQAQSIPAKSWMEHGNEYATRLSLRADFAEKQRVVQEREDLSTKGKKQLQAFLRMEEVAAEAQAQGLDLGVIKRQIDGKGVVIFTLESGGSIRDAGRDVFFSPQDKAAREIATLYAAKKWGKEIQVEGNRLIKSHAPEWKMERERRNGLER